MSVEILSTSQGNGAVRGLQLIDLLLTATTRPLSYIGVVNKLDRQRRRVLLTTQSTCRGKFSKSGVWHKVSEGSTLIFGDTQISLKHKVG